MQDKTGNRFAVLEKFPAVLILCTMALMTLYAWAVLHAETQVEVISLFAIAAVAAIAIPRLGLLDPLRRAVIAAPRLLGSGCVAGVLVLLLAFHETHFALLLLATVMLYAVVGLGLNIQLGYCGIVNFSGAAFFGVGSYTAAVLSTQSPLPHLVILVLGGLMAAIIGSLLILPVLRTRGHYAALVTIAFGILFKNFLEVNDTLGGPQGLKIPGMKIFGWVLSDNITIGDFEISFYANYVLLTLLLCVVAFILVRRLERSWIGLSMDMVRTDEVAAAVFGVQIARWKIVAFTLGNFLVGLSGALYGMMSGYVAPNNFTFADSLILVSILILGGIGNPWGILPAAAIVLILPEKLQFIQEYRFLLYAILVIVILLFRPAGLLPRGVRAYFPGKDKA
ncbi:MAG: branched-chain amino acid ABC transporter permease [Herminiimonas sp.]|nr:branched-chain amino acid ABC transporter permease [Herminiimonas sp.]